MLFDLYKNKVCNWSSYFLVFEEYLHINSTKIVAYYERQY